MSTSTTAPPAAARTAPEAATPSSAVAGQATPCDERTILLLDGAQCFLRLEETLLRRAGWTVLTARTAAEARTIMGERRVDLLLTDHALPDATGDEMVRWVRSREESRDTGILIVTARGMEEQVDRCMQAGCTSFLYKPVSRSVLSARVQELLRVPARRHVRTLVRLEVKAESHGRYFFGSSVNLSASGVLLESDLDLAVGDTLSVRFFLPGDERAVDAEGRVVRRDGGLRASSWAYGIAFDRLAPHDRNRLEMFVETSRLFDPAPVGDSGP